MAEAAKGSYLRFKVTMGVGGDHLSMICLLNLQELHPFPTNAKNDQLPILMRLNAGSPCASCFLGFLSSLEDGIDNGIELAAAAAAAAAANASAGCCMALSLSSLSLESLFASLLFGI
uniref:Uncharacterized protein n=1 Tax=Oryza brachyantha TaxID=4533 RepID=J3M5I3_ORYBR